MISEKGNVNRPSISKAVYLKSCHFVWLFQLAIIRRFKFYRWNIAESRWLNQSTHFNVVNSTSIIRFCGFWWCITSVLYKPFTVLAKALSYESLVIPAEAIIWVSCKLLYSERAGIAVSVTVMYDVLGLMNLFQRGNHPIFNV